VGWGLILRYWFGVVSVFVVGAWRLYLVLQCFD